MSTMKTDLLDMTWITKLHLPYNRLVQLPDTLTRLTQLGIHPLNPEPWTLNPEL